MPQCIQLTALHTSSAIFSHNLYLLPSPIMAVSGYVGSAFSDNRMPQTLPGFQPLPALTQCSCFIPLQCWDSYRRPPHIRKRPPGTWVPHGTKSYFTPGLLKPLIQWQSVTSNSIYKLPSIILMLIGPYYSARISRWTHYFTYAIFFSACTNIYGTTITIFKSEIILSPKNKLLVRSFLYK